MTRTDMPAQDQASRDEDGFTIIEMAITVMLLGIVSFVLFSFLDSSMKITTRASKDLQAEQRMTIALRQMTQEIRSADSVTQCAGNVSYKTCIVIDVPRETMLGAACPLRRITYQLVGTTVRETRVTYPAAACSPTTTTYNARPVLEGVVNTAAQPLFTFYDQAGTTFDPDVSPGLVASAGSVKTSIKVNYGVSGAPVISLDSMAALRNQR